MPFRPPKKQPQFADLKGILAQSKNQLDQATYQTIQEIIERLSQFQNVTLEEVAGKLSEAQAVLKFATKHATYLTTEDETSSLPNSVQLVAGTGVSFDDSVPNIRTINSTGGGGTGNYYDSPLTDGNIDETHLIFANGECIIVQVPI